MDSPVLLTLAAIAGISAISALAALFYPARSKNLHGLMLVFVGVAVGALLGDAFIHLIPEASETLGDSTALWVLLGMGIFFILEKFLHWHHHHEPHQETGDACDDCDDHVRPFGFLIIFADILHNVVDGVIIAAAFLVSTEAGVATTIAVALHELPQEIGDFGVLLHAGFSRTRALIANVASALSAFLGAGLVFLIGAYSEAMIPALSALAAGSFIYIAAADLVPELHKHARVRDSLIQFLAVIVGVVMMFGLTFFEASAPEIVPDTGTAFETTLPEAPHEINVRPTGAVLLGVTDGDTIRVRTEGGSEEKVRLLGIDAPETNAGKNGPPECFASEATEALRSILPKDSHLVLITDPTQDTRDTYGRLLAYVYIGRTHVNELLVAEGAAREYTYKNRTYNFQTSFRNLEETARLSARGLWANCR